MRVKDYFQTHRFAFAVTMLVAPLLAAALRNPFIRTWSARSTATRSFQRSFSCSAELGIGV